MPIWRGLQPAVAYPSCCFGHRFVPCSALLRACVPSSMFRSRAWHRPRSPPRHPASSVGECRCFRPFFREGRRLRLRIFFSRSRTFLSLLAQSLSLFSLLLSFLSPSGRTPSAAAYRRGKGGSRCPLPYNKPRFPFSGPRPAASRGPCAVFRPFPSGSPDCRGGCSAGLVRCCPSVFAVPPYPMMMLRSIRLLAMA